MKLKEIKALAKRAYDENRYIQFTSGKIWSEERVILHVSDEFFVHTALNTSTKTRPKRFFESLAKIKILGVVEATYMLSLNRSREAYLNSIAGEDERSNEKEKQLRQIRKRIKDALENTKNIKRFSSHEEMFLGLLEEMEELFEKYLKE